METENHKSNMRGVPRMRILLVEDDELLGKALETGLRQGNYMPEWVKDGETALLAAETGGFSAVALDINLPKLSGLEVLKKLRQNQQIPVVIMTARDALMQRVEGLDLGADDYLVKPFEMDELLARLRAVIRRSQGRSKSIITFHDIEMDTNARKVTKAGEWVRLSAREYQILSLLMERAGRIISKSDIEEQIYSWDGNVESNTVEAAVYTIRKKLGKELITTIRGVGYMVNI